MKKLRSILVGLKNNNPWLLFLWHIQLRKRGIRNLKKYSDMEAINSLYFSFSGKLPNLKQPKTFSEKQQWLKLHYHNPLMTQCADKYEVRKYLKTKGYEYLLNEVFDYYTNISTFDLEKLPNKFVLKASHGSGWNLVVNDKRRINWFVWKKILEIWLKSNIFWPGREWPYKNMKASIIAEKYLEDESGQLMDFKFFCFNGVPKFIQANKGRGTKNHAQNFYDLDWKILPFGKDLKPRPDIAISQPTQLSKMIEIATNLSQDFPFVRVDLYEVQNKIIFGELTFFPKSGLPDLNPIEYDLVIGKMLQLPKPYDDE